MLNGNNNLIICRTMQLSVSVLVLLLLPPCVAEDCKLDSIPALTDFNPIAFQGRWYVISVNQFWMSLPLIAKLLTPKNAQITYTVNDVGDVNVTACGSFVGPFCDFMTGYAEIPDKSQSHLIHLQFNTFYLQAAKPNPYWVIATDYEFAVVYSCYQKMEDGTCNPSKAYLWTLNRNRKGHTLVQKAAIEEAAAKVCMEFANGNVTTIFQDGECDIMTSHFHKGPGMLFVVFSALIGFIMILICCSCCISKSTKVTKEKKRQ